MEKLTLSELHQLREKYNDLYYNTDNSGGVSDEIYDLLIETIKEKEPDGYQNPVGATVKQNQVSLPYYLGSMNKCRDQKEIEKWVKKYSRETSFIVEDKLDGVSCLMVIDKKNVIKLFTRGDGNVGTDISHFAQVINNKPKKNQKQLLAIRGELIMKKSTFEKKYRTKFANPRNLISGIINSKTIKEEAYDIDFIPYEIISGVVGDISYQFDVLKAIFSTIVSYRVINKDEINTESLITSLIDMKSASDYEIDGIIIHSSAKYIRNTSGNPEYAFAFKTMLLDNIIDTEVESVEWNITKWNVYKPRIKIRPVDLCGVTIQYATGFNAKYIKENSVGKGAIVSITRSNDVIPYIVKVLKPGVVQYPEDDYVWNDSGVDIISNSGKNDSADIKTISSFFSELGIKHVSDATISKLFENGQDSLVKILNLSQEDFAKIDGFGEKLAERTFANIHSGLEKSSIKDAISASSCFGFGFGKKKIQKLLQSIPDFYNKEVVSLTEIMAIEGFSEKTATQALYHIPEVQQFVEDISPFVGGKEPVAVVSSFSSNKLHGNVIVFSGFRDKDLEDFIQKNGGSVGNSVSKSTTLVVTKNPDDSSSKLKKAKENKIPILTKEDFEKKFFI